MLFKTISKSVIFILLFMSVDCGAQISEIDSLKRLLKKTASDTEKVNISVKIADRYLNENPTKGLRILLEIEPICVKLNFRLYRYYYDLAFSYFTLCEYQKSIAAYKKAQFEAEKLNSPLKEDYFGRINEGLAFVYMDMQNYQNAILAQEKAIDYYSKNKDDLGVAIGRLNLGRMYLAVDNTKKAKELYLQAESTFLERRDTVYLLNVYTGMGNVFTSENSYQEALSYLDKAFELTKKNDGNNLSRKAIILVNKSNCHNQLKMHQVALAEALEALSLNKQINSPLDLELNYKQLAEICTDMDDPKKAIEYYKKYNVLKDSLFNADNNKVIHEMSAKYESDKKEKENQVLSLENKNKKQVIYFAFGGCGLLLGLVFFIFTGYRNKQKANKLLEEKSIIIHEQKTIVENQHQDITDSIKYAQRIQGAILPPKEMWEKMLPNSFILYMPKDILSGDFYWIEENEDYIYVAAADCTGHGVPGALISIVNFNLLNKALLEKSLITPSDILDAVNIWLTESLHQTYGESAVRDGMDVALIAIHKHSNEILYAGANNPIYHVSNGELVQIKADKFPVGAFVEDKIQKFTTKRFTVQKGDTIYLFSDGFADQFGGDKGKKYKYSPFQEKLKTINSLPLINQQALMKEEFLNWKGTLEQVDDVLLIGIKIV